MHNKINISDLIGQPFKKDSKGGYNCYTLCQEVSKRIGRILPEQQFVDDLSNRNDLFLHNLEKLCVEIEKPEPYCYVALSVRHPYVTHIGVVLEDSVGFIHVMRKRCVVVERLDSLNWVKKIKGYYRYVE